MAAASHTVVGSIIYCGVNNVVLLEGNTQAERMATGIFDNYSNSCMGKTVDELEQYFRYYSVLTVIQGQIRLNHVTKKDSGA